MVSDAIFSLLTVDHNDIKMKNGYVNPLRPNSDPNQTSHSIIMGLSGSEVMRIENMITEVKFY